MAGALLDVPLDTRLAAGHADRSAAVRVAVDYLTSYEGHGIVSVRCARGCTCPERTVDGHVPAEPLSGRIAANASGAPNASTFLSFELRVTGASADCALQLLVLNATSSGRHKFKVRYVNVWAEEEGGSADAAGAAAGGGGGAGPSDYFSVKTKSAGAAAWP